MIGFLRATLWQFLKQSQAVRQSAYVAVGNVVVAFFMAIAMVLVSRSLGPEKFGVFSISLAIMAVVSRFVDAGTNQLVPRFMNRWHDNPARIRDFLGQIALWKFILAVVAMILGLAAVPIIIQLLRYQYPTLITWAIVGGLIMGAYEHVLLVLSARHKFIDGVVLGILQAIIKCVGFVILYLVARQWLSGYLAVYYLAPLLAVSWIVLQQKGDYLIMPKQASEGVRIAMIPFLSHSALNVFAITLLANLDVFMIQRLLSTFDTGIYSGASRIALLISFTIAAMGGVLTNRVSRYREKSTLRLYLKKSLLLVVASVVGFITFLPFARSILMLSIGVEYISGLLPMIILIANSFVTMSLLPYIAIFYSVDHPKYFSLSGLLQVGIIFVGNLFFLPQYGLMAAALVKITATIAYGLFTLAYLFIIWRKMEE